MMIHKPRQAAPLEFEITIEKLVYGGAGLGHYAGKVVFVRFSAPGDRLMVRSVEQKKNFMRATIIRMIEPGPARGEFRCPHFGKCGGCQWQHIEYTRQVEIKRQILEEAVRHRFPETRMLTIEMKPSPQPYGYRSRARVQVRGFGANASTGFYRFESHSVEDVESCPLLHPALNAALASVRELRRRGLSDAGTREVALACSGGGDEWSAAEADPSLEEGFSALGKPDKGISGAQLLRRNIAGFEYTFSPTVFFQSNDLMLEDLVSRVCRLAQDSDAGAALDLFSGVGLFALPLARRFKEVTAVESSPQACQLCQQNATAAGFDNVRVVSADAESWMNSVSKVTAPGFDLVVLDPPRSGAGPAIMRLLMQWAPETILYVSCDPQTLCRDVAILPSRDYRIDFVEGLDLFPQTYHFETIMRLRRNKP